MSISIAATSSASGEARSGSSTMAAKLATRMMRQLDADRNGSVTQQEFVAGMAKTGVSEAEATKLFGAIDTQNKGTIEKSDIQAAINNGTIKPAEGPRPVAPKQGGVAAGGSDANSLSYDPADTNRDGVVSAQEAAIYGRKHPPTPGAPETEPEQLGQNVDELV